MPLIDVSALVRACKLGSRFASSEALSALDSDTDSFEMEVDVSAEDDADFSSVVTEEVVFNVVLPFCTSPPRRTRRRDARGRQAPYLIPSPAEEYPLHVVFDLDETLVFARNGPVVLRPFLQQLMTTVQSLRCEVILWTAGAPAYVNNILHGIEAGTGVHRWAHYVIHRNARWWKEGDPNPKDLRCLGRDLKRLILIDNNPACGQLQPDSTVLVEDFDQREEHDETLLAVSSLLEQVSSEVVRGRTVKEALAASSMLRALSFDLAAEHVVGNVATRFNAIGLRYSTSIGTYAGEKAV